MHHQSLNPVTKRATQDAMRNKIASFCGRTGIDTGYVPDYFGDANAIESALLELHSDDMVTAYCDNLNRICGADVDNGKASCVAYFASTDQKAEALWMAIHFRGIQEFIESKT